MRCLKPVAAINSHGGVRTEIVRHAIACIPIRERSLQRLSFNGTVDVLWQWLDRFENTNAQPRAVKRRRKSFR